MTCLAAMSLIKANSFQRQLPATWRLQSDRKINYKVTSGVKKQNLPVKTELFSVLLKFSVLITP
jgi:hypothetical protein